MKILVAFLVMVGGLGSYQAIANDRIGNGGDAIAQDFVTSAQDGLKFLRQHANEFSFIDESKVENAINTANIMVLPAGSSFQDAVRTAENFPQSNQIQIDGDRWQPIKEPIRKMALALHEYLGLTGYEVNNYIITSQLFGIANDQMEAPPTLAELDHSFDGLRDGYMKMLASAKALTPTPVYGEEHSLTEAECQAFLKTQIATPAGIYFYGCTDLRPVRVSLVTQDGTNALGVTFNKIFRVTREATDTTSDYFINDKGRIVEKVEAYRTCGACHSYDKYYQVTKLALLDRNGNGYQHDVSGWESPENSLADEFVSVVLANGSLGGYIAKEDSYGSDGSVSSEVTFSVADFPDWQSFDIELYDSFADRCSNSNLQCSWGTTEYDTEGGMVFSYNYLGQQYSQPDNYREITYHTQSNLMDLDVWGTYVANRRVYQVSKYSPNRRPAR